MGCRSRHTIFSATHESMGLASFNSIFMQLRGTFRGSFLTDAVRSRGHGNGPGKGWQEGSPGGRILPSPSQPTGVDRDERQSGHPVPMDSPAGRAQGRPPGIDGHSCTGVSSKNPDCGPAWKILGSALIDIGRHAEAEGALKRAIALLPPGQGVDPPGRDGPPAQVPWRVLGRGLVVWPGHPVGPGRGRRAHRAGGILARFGRLQEAEAAHRAATSCTKGPLEEAYLNLGLVLRAEQRYDEAAVCLEQALELDPKYTAAKNALRDVRQTIRFLKRKDRNPGDCSPKSHQLTQSLREK